MRSRSSASFVSAASILVLLSSPSPSKSAIITQGDAEFNGDILVAQNGDDGRLTLTSPTELEGGGIFIANQPTVSGSVVIDGASYEGSGDFEIGQGGTASLEIINGGSVSNSSHDLRIGSGENGNGEVVVSGLGSMFTVRSTVVGAGATGSLIVEAGATAVSQDVRLGRGGSRGLRPYDGNGTATIRGVGSRWDVQRFVVGSGTLAVEDGGRLVSGPADSIVGSSNQRGSVIVQGVGSHWLHPGEVRVFNGDQIVRDGAIAEISRLRLGQSWNIPIEGISASVRVSGLGSRLSLGEVQLDSSDQTEIIVTNGGQFTAGTLTQSFSARAPIDASIRVSGLGSRLSVAELQIYPPQQLDILVADGGYLETGSLPQHQEGLRANVIVAGLGSWLNSALGVQFSGELRLLDGAYMTSSGMSLGSDLFESPHADVRVSGQGTLWSLGSLDVYGTSEVDVLNGASVSSAEIRLGDDHTGLVASMRIAGPGSHLATDDFRINRLGRLTLEPGSQITNVRLAHFRNDPISNEGLIEGSGTIAKSVVNERGGLIRIDRDQQLVIDTLSNTEQGVISLYRGELDVRGLFSNQSEGTVAMVDSVLHMGSLGSQVASNHGLILSLGRNEVHGELISHANGEIRLNGSQLSFHDAVTNLGVIDVPSGSSARFLGPYSGMPIEGNGSIRFENQVAFGPGSVDDVSLDSWVSFEDTSNLIIDLSNDGHDELDIARSMSLAGALSFNALQPMEGDLMAEILSASRVDGTFDQVPDVGTDLGFGVVFGGITYNPDSVVVSLLQQTGDVNSDGRVDSLDIESWSADYGLTGGALLSDGDADRDGDVDGADWLMMQREMQQAASAASSQTVPEPTAGGLLLMSALSLSGRRRR